MSADRLTDAIKAASRLGEMTRPSAADFGAATVGWGRQAAHLYILPLNFEAAIRAHDRAHPEAPLGGPPLDFHAADKETSLALASDETDCAKVIKKVHGMGDRLEGRRAGPSGDRRRGGRDSQGKVLIVGPGTRNRRWCDPGPGNRGEV